DWTEGRGEKMALVTLIDAATDRLEAAFYPGRAVESHLDLLGRWLQKHGRPLGLYLDRNSLGEPKSKGRPDGAGQTQFKRAVEELGIELISARGRQAKGRVARFFELAHDHWVKELRCAGVRTRGEANRLLRQELLPEYNRQLAVVLANATDA